MQFSIVFTNVICMAAYMLFGFLLIKGRKAEMAHSKTLSGILIYICGPAMVIYSFQGMTYSPDDFRSIGLFTLVTLAIQVLVVGTLWLTLHRRYADARYRILTVSAVMGNVGFLGLPLCLSLFPGEPIVACYSTAYSLGMNLIIFTLGVYMITQDKKYMSLKAALLNPTNLTVILVLPFYLLDIRLPRQAMDMLSVLSRMSMPLCMFILGMRLASSDLKNLFGRPFVYVSCAFKLIAYPLFAYLCVRFIPGLNTTFKACVLVLSAMPSASILLSLVELHGHEQENSAGILLASSLLCIATIPLMLLIL